MQPASHIWFPHYSPFLFGAIGAETISSRCPPSDICSHVGLGILRAENRTLFDFFCKKAVYVHEYILKALYFVFMGF